jgi:hypothetical protein
MLALFGHLIRAEVDATGTTHTTHAHTHAHTHTHAAAAGIVVLLMGRASRVPFPCFLPPAEPGTLLRSNNMLSALLSKHLQLVGRSYVPPHPIFLVFLIFLVV